MRRLGDVLRDVKLRQVERNADPEWMLFAVEALHRVAERRRELVSDTVWIEMEAMAAEQGLPGIPPTHENRAMGAVFRIARSAGWIEPTGKFVKTFRPSCHSNPRRVWLSVV